MPLEHIIKILSSLSPSCTLPSFASLLDDSHINSEILLLGHLQIDDGYAG